MVSTIVKGKREKWYPFLLSLLVFLSISFLLSSCRDDYSDSDPSDSDDPFNQSYTIGSFTVTVAQQTGEKPQLSITHSQNPERVLWQSVPGKRLLSAAIGMADIEETRGSFDIDDTIQSMCTIQTITGIVYDGPKSVTLYGTLSGADDSTDFSFVFESRGLNKLYFSIELGNKEGGFNRIFLHYASQLNERFYGFGEQYTYLNMKGLSFPIIPQEQGIGRGAEPLTSLMNLVSPGSGGTWYTTYISVPHYISSIKRSLCLENYEISWFNLENPSEVEIKLFSPSMSGYIFYGNTYLDLVEEYTSLTGRMPELPDWIHDGAIVGMQGGTANVYGKLSLLQQYDTPITSFWLQDWVGKRTTVIGSQLWWNWELNEDWYPGWDTMVQSLAAQNIRVLTYINPFLVDVEGMEQFTRNLYREAVENGYLVKDQEGNPYLITNTDFDAGLVDFTNPDAWLWYKNIIKDNVLGVGASGWMADFAEALPFDALLHSGIDPAIHHSQYPQEWARMNREAIEEEGLLGDVVFFNRSGYRLSPGYCTLFWLGDQSVTWDEHDGLKSAIKGMLSSGISGFSLNHSDIGGYTTFNPVIMRSRELLLRWMDANVFTAVFRTHEGNQPESNSQFYSDVETLAHFARTAKIYQAFAFYRKLMVQEAAEKGYPYARHLLFHYPAEQTVWDLEYEWMVGPDFLIAPVVDEGQLSVDVYLPQGEWVHVWSGKTYGDTEKGLWITVDAPLGEPPVFFIKGSTAGQTFIDNLQNAGLL